MTDRDAFIEGNLRLVHSCCHKFTGKGIEYDDLYLSLIHIWKSERLLSLYINLSDMSLEIDKTNLPDVYKRQQ